MLRFAVVLTFCLCAHADTYQVFGLGSDSSRNLMGLDDAGNVAVIAHCPTGPCYDIYADGVFSSQTTDISQFQYTKGGVVNPAAKSLFGNSYLVMVNAEGDYAWIDAQHEVIMEAVDLTSRSYVASLALAVSQIPEPATWMLLGTGIVLICLHESRRNQGAGSRGRSYNTAA